MDAVTEYWKAQAVALGWADFEDAEDDALLVVAGDDYPVHFTGPHAWQEAVEWTRANKGG